jgi:hypothetical protein
MAALGCPQKLFGYAPPSGSSRQTLSKATSKLAVVLRSKFVMT